MHPAVRSHYNLEELWGEKEVKLAKPEAKPRRAARPKRKAKPKAPARGKAARRRGRK
jgi:hypothetical protein